MALGSFISDTFGGGAEKKAGRRIADAQERNYNESRTLRKYLNSLYDPYKKAGDKGLEAYQNAVYDQQGNPLPQFNYGGQLPKFDYQNNIPGYQDNSNIPNFNYDNNLPQFGSNSPLPQYNDRSRFGFNPQDIVDSPAYQFRLDQGLKATDRVNAAQGNRGSGKRLTDLVDYASGLASTEYGNEFDRRRLQSRENYGRSVDEYGFDTNRSNTKYDRGVLGYDIETNRQNSLYDRNLGRYDINRANETEAYDRNLSTYEINQGNENTLYDRADRGYDRSFNRDSENYGRAGDLYSSRYTRNQDTYNRGQNSLDRYRDLTEIGQYGTDNTANSRLATTGMMNNALLGRAEGRASGDIGAANSIRNTVGDAAFGYGAYRASRTRRIPSNTGGW